jgi:hypothetical protein
MLDSSSTHRSMSHASLPSTSHPTCSLLPGSRYCKQRPQPRDVSLSGIAKDRSHSAGSSWEAEFARYSDAEHLQKASQRLELTWKVAKVPISPSFASFNHFTNHHAACTHCEGQGSEPCPWCNSTGESIPSPASIWQCYVLI